MRSTTILVILLVGSAFLTPTAVIGEELRFEEPLTIGEVFRPVMVDAGDFNGDGKLDLVAVSGSDSVHILLQDPSNRTSWKASDLKLGVGSYFVRAADFDGDGFDDLIVADPATTAYFVRSKGDGGFATPEALPDARTSRWIAIGDWNSDGHLDFASANHDTSTVSVFVGDGKGGFTQTQKTTGDDTHAIEATDYDGNGKLDLALSVGTAGAAVFSGHGDGKFGPLKGVSDFGCARYMATGDFNNDGMGDLSLVCDTAMKMTIAIGDGKGNFKQSLAAKLPLGTETPAVGDLNGDGNQDVAVPVSAKPGIAVYLGNGDGTFAPQPLFFGPIGEGASFFISRDLDNDGRQDLVSANAGSSSLSILWGRAGESFLESACILPLDSTSQAFALADWDHDGKPDLFFSPSTRAGIHVYLDPAGCTTNTAPLSIKTAFIYSSLEVLDVDGDGVLDLVGTDSSSAALVSLLDRDGKVREESSLPAGSLPAAIAVGKLDDDAIWDLAVPCRGANQVAVFLGQAGGKFDAARIVPTLPRPDRITLADLDVDGKTDMVIVSTKAVAAHYAKGGGDYSDAQSIVSGSVNGYLDAAVADVDGDEIPDLVILTADVPGIRIIRGKGARQFERPVSLDAGIGKCSGLSLVDFDHDGLVDIAASSKASGSVALFQNFGTGSFSAAAIHRVGAVDLGPRFADLNLDGTPDIVALSGKFATIFLGRAGATPTGGRFRRGDVDGDGKVAITDAVQVLGWLFRGQDPPACVDAADFNDDAVVNLTDPVGTLEWLFQGGEPPSPPGAVSCGQDPTPDALPECAGACVE